MKKIINNISNLDVASNEYSLNSTVQRIVDRLFENDVLLKKFYEEVFGEFLIYEYDQSATYEYSQVIWFLDKSNTLHILRCDKNKVLPGSLSSWPSKSFSDLGWKDLNPNIDILTQYGIEKRLRTYITKMFKLHTDDELLHKYGKLSYDTKSRNSLSAKIALNDFSNIDSSREQNFFPYKTVCLQSKENNAIINGFVRQYDNGLLEYDIVFRLSYAGYQEVDKEYKISADVMKCNQLDLTNQHNCDKYFCKPSDMSIFSQPSDMSSYTAEIGATQQQTRNDYVNVYSAVIDFANAAGNGNEVVSQMYQYENTDYMVFCSDVMSQNRDSKSDYLNPSPNAITFCNKKNGQITAVLVTYPNRGNYNKKGQNAQNTGLEANSFHCHIVGRGRKIR